MKELLFLAAIKINPDEIGLPHSTTNVEAGFANTVKLLMGLIGALAVIFVIVGGLQIATSAGNPARIKQGRETVIYSVVGIVVAIGAYAIVSFIAGRV